MRDTKTKRARFSRAENLNSDELDCTIYGPEKTSSIKRERKRSWCQKEDFETEEDLTTSEFSNADECREDKLKAKPKSEVNCKEANSEDKKNTENMYGKDCRKQRKVEESSSDASTQVKSESPETEEVSNEGDSSPPQDSADSDSAQLGLTEEAQPPKPSPSELPASNDNTHLINEEKCALPQEKQATDVKNTTRETSSASTQNTETLEESQKVENSEADTISKNFKNGTGEPETINLPGFSNLDKNIGSSPEEASQKASSMEYPEAGMQQNQSFSPAYGGCSTYSASYMYDFASSGGYYTNDTSVPIPGYTNPVNGAGAKKNFRFFLGGIPPDITEEAIKAYFLNFGEVSEVRIARDYHTGTSRGFAFVTVIEESVKRTIFQTQHEIQGKKVDVREENNSAASDVNRKIFAGGLDPTWDEKYLANYFGQFGEVELVHIITDGTGKSRCFAFITFVEDKAANDVLEKGVHNMKERRIEVRKAEPKRQRSNYRSFTDGYHGWVAPHPWYPGGTPAFDVNGASMMLQQHPAYTLPQPVDGQFFGMPPVAEAANPMHPANSWYVNPNVAAAAYANQVYANQAAQGQLYNLYYPGMMAPTQIPNYYLPHAATAPRPMGPPQMIGDSYRDFCAANPAENSCMFRNPTGGS